MCAWLFDSKQIKINMANKTIEKPGWLVSATEVLYGDGLDEGKSKQAEVQEPSTPNEATLKYFTTNRINTKLLQEHGNGLYERLVIALNRYLREERNISDSELERELSRISLGAISLSSDAKTEFDKALYGISTVKPMQIESPRPKREVKKVYL